MRALLLIAAGTLAALSPVTTAMASPDAVGGAVGGAVTTARAEAPARPERTERRYLLALDCAVALSTLEGVGAHLNSSSDAWVDRIVDLGDRLGRPGMLEWQFRHTEISASLEVEPEKTTRWILATAELCVREMPTDEGPRRMTLPAGVSRSPS